MKQFTDDAGDVWTLKADVNALERIRDLADIDLLQLLSDQDQIAKLTGTTKDFVAALWAWCQPQIETRELSPEEFGGRLYESFDAAFEAVLEELPNFFPPHRRTLASQLIQKFLEAERLGDQRAQSILSSGKMDDLISQAIDKAEADAIRYAESLTGNPPPTSPTTSPTGGSTSTSSPESSGKTPDR
jgi:hypothetical protein